MKYVANFYSLLNRFPRWKLRNPDRKLLGSWFTGGRVSKSSNTSNDQIYYILTVLDKMNDI